MLKFVLINNRDSNRKLPKILPVKTHKWHKKASRADLIEKGPGAVLKKDACAVAKHKIILS